MKKLGILASAVALTASSLFGEIAVGKGLTVGGFLDIQYKSLSDDVNDDADTNGFDATTAEFNFGFDFGNGLSATIDLEGNVGSDGADGQVDFEQARIDYAFGDSNITIGKFETFIGLEAIDAPDLYQITTGLTFAQAPLQHTGINYRYDNGMFNVQVGLVNALIANDDDNSGANSNDELTYLAHAGLTPTDSLSFNVNYAQGDEANTAVGADEPIETTFFSVDASWSDFGWTVGAEYIQVETETSAGDMDDLDGYMLMVNYMFTEQFGLTARISATEDDVDNEEMTEFTISPSYAITPNWFLLAEYRVDETEDDTGTTAETDTIAIRSLLTF